MPFTLSTSLGPFDNCVKVEQACTIGGVDVNYQYVAPGFGVVRIVYDDDNPVGPSHRVFDLERFNIKDYPPGDLNADSRTTIDEVQKVINVFWD